MKKGNAPPSSQTSPEAVRTQLDKILQSGPFAPSERMTRFLRFIVEETLAQRADQLSEYAIGVEAYDRGESFEPSTDSIVRVDARRLRAKLREYYDTAGLNDPLLIEVPKGTYSPVFVNRPMPPAPSGEASIDPAVAAVSTEPATHSETADRSARSRWAVVLAALAILVVGYMLANSSGDQDAGARPPVPPGRILLAVLPFDNYSGNPELDYLVGGLTEEVIAQLGRLNPNRLGVIARTSAESYKAAAKPIGLMGDELGVDYAVEGSFRRENEQVRITVQLIDVRDRTHTWVENYEQRLDSVLQLQTEVANLISRSLALKLLDRPDAPMRVSGTSNAVAYEAYLTGRYFREQITESGFRKGIEYFEKAIVADPAFAQAYSGLAGCYCLLGGHGLEVERPNDVLPRAREEAEAALELSESLEEAHGVLGMISLKYDWEFEEAERHFRRATDLNPSYAQGFLWYSLYYEVTGQTGEAIAKAQRARDLDPLALGANLNLAQQYYRADRHDEAVQQLEKVLELSPNFWAAHWILGDSGYPLYSSDESSYPWTRAVGGEDRVC